jgi:hypothetical protein
MSPGLKIPRKYSIKNSLLSLKKLIISKKSERSIEEIKSKNREIESLNNSNTSSIQGEKMPSISQ